MAYDPDSSFKWTLAILVAAAIGAAAYFAYKHPKGVGRGREGNPKSGQQSQPYNPRR